MIIYNVGTSYFKYKLSRNNNESLPDLLDKY